MTSLDPRLPKNIGKRLWVDVVARFARDCHAPGLSRVNILLVAPLLRMQAPSVILDQPDNLANLGGHYLNSDTKSSSKARLDRKPSLATKAPRWMHDETVRPPWIFAAH